MSENRRNTPDLQDHGHGGKGSVSNTSYPESPGEEDTTTGHLPHVATEQSASEAEAAAAMREFDKSAP